MRVVYKMPGAKAAIKEIPNELRYLQQLVGGYIETVRLSEHLVLICNEEGKLGGLEPNIYVQSISDIVCGPVIFVGVKGDQFVSLNKGDAEHLAGLFRGEEVRYA